MMTIEQRVLTALRCEQPDRVPVFLYLDPHADDEWYSDDPSYADLLEVCGSHSDVVRKWGFPDPFLHLIASQEQQERTLPDGNIECTIHTPRGPLTSVTRKSWRGQGFIKRWITEPRDVTRLLSIPYVPVRPDISTVVQARAESGNRWVVQAMCPDPICIAELVDESVMAVWTIERRDLIRELLSVSFERIMETLDYCLAGGVGPIYLFYGPEFALPPLMSPRDFDEFAMDYDTQLVERVHSYPGNYTIIHSHGKISGFLERFAATGTDGLNTLEPPPIGDTILADAKKRIGDRVCLIGNIQYDDIARGTHAEIEQLVKQSISEGAPGGGFCLSPCAAPYESPLPSLASRNFIHYLKMGREHGQYGSDASIPYLG
jgi:hypothetical protein